MKCLVLLAALQVALAVPTCVLNSQYAVANSSGCFNTASFVLSTGLNPCSGGNASCCVNSGVSLTVTCAAGLTAVGSLSATCTTGNPNVFNNPGSLVCTSVAPPPPPPSTGTVCTVTCVTTYGGTCVSGTGTSLVTGNTVAVGSTVACASGTFAVDTISGSTQPCNTAGSTLTVTCAAATSITGFTTVPPFATTTLLTSWLASSGLPYVNPNGVCNVVCTIGTVGTSITGCTNQVTTVTNTQYSCSNCYTCTPPTGTVNTGMVFVVCPWSTTSLQWQCFSNAACAGLIPSNAGCGLNGVGNCPGCGGSKKGLLGLLGLLGLIPLLLCYSLLCLLLLCCIRRRKTDAAVHFATFDAGAPAIAPPPVAVSAVPVMAPTAVEMCAPAPFLAPHVDVCAPHVDVCAPGPYGGFGAGGPLP